MQAPKEDRRVTKTKRQLRTGLATLMQGKSINRITVKELADLVDINRATFYAHYRDVYDLVEQIESYFLAVFQDILSRHIIQDRNLDLLPLLTDIFTAVGSEADMGRALMGKHGDAAFVRQVQEQIGGYFEYYWHKLNPDDTGRNQHHSYVFVLSGCTGLLQSWLEGDMQESPQEMAAVAARLVRSGLQNFLPA